MLESLSIVKVPLSLPEARLHVYSIWWWGAAWTSFRDNGLGLLHEASTGAPSRPRRTRCSFCCPWFLLVSGTTTKEQTHTHTHIKTRGKKNNLFIYLFLPMSSIFSLHCKKGFTSSLLTKDTSPFLSTLPICKTNSAVVLFVLRN